MPVIIIHSDGTVERSAAEEVKKVVEERRPQHMPELELGLEVVVPTSEPPMARPRPTRRPN